MRSFLSLCHGKHGDTGCEQPPQAQQAGFVLPGRAAGVCNGTTPGPTSSSPGDRTGTHSVAGLGLTRALRLCSFLSCPSCGCSGAALQHCPAGDKELVTAPGVLRWVWGPTDHWGAHGSLAQPHASRCPPPSHASELNGRNLPPQPLTCLPHCPACVTLRSLLCCHQWCLAQGAWQGWAQRGQLTSTAAPT